MEGGIGPGAVLLEKYRVESLLGRGGMGVVLRVTHLDLGEELAIKILLPETAIGPEVHARFLREARSAVRLRGEHVTRVSDVGMLPQGAPYIVMEYLRGSDLAAELGRRGMLPPGEAVDHVLQACEALAEAHSLGIVHRDVKPSNLFLTSRPDGTPLLKVLDFGISKAPIAGPGLLTRTDAVMGTPGYMSPEQMKASKDVDARTDIWSLGIVLYECVNGRRPFDADSFSAVVLRAATEPPPPMDPRIHRGLQVVVLRCLEKDRAARFQSMAELAAALAPFARDGRAAGIIAERAEVMLRGSSVVVASSARPGPVRTATTLSGSAGVMPAPSKRRRYAIGGAAAVLAAIVGLSAMSARTSSYSNGSTPEPSVQDRRAADDRGATLDQADAMPATAARPADAAQILAPSPDDAAVVTAPDPEGDRNRQKVAHCQEIKEALEWQKLRDCAGDLAALGLKDKADEFRVMAANEPVNEATAGRVQSALRQGNLREAQKQLKMITPESVYLAATAEMFQTAEAQLVEDSRRKALAMASAHDCAGLKRFQAQITSSSTPAVSTAISEAKCEEGATSVSPSDRGTVAQPAGAGAISSSTKTPSPTKRVSGCDAINVKDQMTRAQNQFVAGFAESALELAAKAILCKQDSQMYQMVTMYACAAGNQDAARRYYAHVPTQFKPPIARLCEQEGVRLGP